MHIEKVIISGIRSYKRETVIDDFVPNFNAIVGSNGTGKSGIFIALELLFNWKLMKRLSAVNKRQIVSYRQPQGSVEVVLDNTDERIPIKSLKVTIKRLIADHTDQFRVNDKLMKADRVKGLLLAAGLTPENPYYIVEQGQMSAMIGLCDEQILGIIEDAAGVTSHKERSEKQIMRLMETSEKYITQADDFVEKLIANIQLIGTTIQDAERYRKIEMDFRAINYFLCDRDVKNNTKKLAQREAELNRSIVKREEVCNRKETLSGHKKDYKDGLRKAELDHECCLSKNIKLEEEMNYITRQKSKIDLERKDLEAKENEKKNKGVLLEKLKLESEETNAVLQTLQNDVDNLKRESNLLIQRAKALEDRQCFLVSIHHSSSCKDIKTVEDRDKFINEMINKLRNSKKRVEENCLDIQNCINNESKSLENLEAKRMSEQHEEAKIMSVLHSSNYMKMFKCKQYELLNESRKHLQVVSEKEAEVKNAKEDERKCMINRLPAAVSKVYSNVKLILNDETNGLPTDDFLGMVADIFTCVPELSAAIDVAAGLKLFRYIVRDDKSATKFMKCWNEARMKGEVYFIALNKLHPQELITVREMDAFPIIEKLHFEERYANLMREIFGRTILCPSLEVACIISRKYKCNSVTVQGDFVSSKGAFSGGYVNASRSMMNNYTEFKEIRKKRENLERTLEGLNRKANELAARQENFQKEFQIGETNRRTLKCIREKIESLMKEKEGMENLLAKCNETLTVHKKKICDIDEKIRNLQDELGKEPTLRRLTEEERLELWELGHRLQLAKGEVASCLEMLRNAEREHYKQKDNIKNMDKKIETVTKVLEELDQGLETIVQNNSSELMDLLEQQEKKIHEKHKDNLNDTKIYSKAIEIHKTKLNEIEDALKEVDDELERYTKHLEEIRTCMARSQKKVNDATARKSTTCAPSRGLREKYSMRSAEELFQKRRDCETLMNRIGKPNLKAVATASSLQEDFMRLKKSLRVFRREARMLAEERNKNEEAVRRATHWAYSHVANEFKRLFETFVPNGHAAFHFFRNDHVVDIDEEEDFDWYDLIQIEVNFNNNDGHMTSLRSLSGGQKAVAALALMFAIQSYSKVPFYLFDEVDQHLDNVYSERVARYMRNYLGDVQVIASSFKQSFLDIADQLLCVTMVNGNSHVEPVTIEEAVQVLERRHQRRATHRITKRVVQNGYL